MTISGPIPHQVLELQKATLDSLGLAGFADGPGLPVAEGKLLFDQARGRAVQNLELQGPYIASDVLSFGEGRLAVLAIYTWPPMEATGGGGIPTSWGANGVGCFTLTAV